MNPWILLIWIPFLLLISGFPDQWTRGEGGLLNDDRIKLHEKETARLVAEMEERDKKKLRPSHRGQRLDDGIQSDRRDNIPIEELMKGFRGFL
jgi:hypothetical protein